LIQIDNLNFKDLEEKLSQGIILMEKLKTGAERVIPGTSPSGCSNIEHELKTLEEEMEELKSELTVAHDELSSRQNQWIEYETMKDEVAKWIDETSDVVKTDLPLGSTEAKENSYKARLVKIDSWIKLCTMIVIITTVLFYVI